MRVLLALLPRAFPRAFRAEFAPGMLEVLLADYEQARARSRGSALWCVASNVADMLGAALSERLNPTWIDPNARLRARRWQVSGFLETWARDFKHAARSLARAPAFTVVAVVTLALAIGANTTIFSVVQAVLLDPLPFPDADRLVAISASAPGSDLPEEFGVGTEFYVHYRENASALEDLAFYGGGQTSVRADDRIERLFIATAPPSLFSTLGVTPVLGRLPRDDDPEALVVVISHWLWTDWFGRDPSVLGSSLEINNRSMTVIGVMRPSFRFPEERIAVWIHDLPTEPIRSGGLGLGLVGRMAPGSDHASLTTQLSALARQLPERFGGPPAYARLIEQHRPIVRSLQEQQLGDVAGPLWILFGTVGVILLIACVNVANLFMVRAEGRRRDLAVRRALGAGRAGLVRTQMAEALLLAAVGGIGGALVAWAGVPLLVRVAPETIGSGTAPIPRLDAAGLDSTALLFAAGISILAACVFGLVPAIRFSGHGLLSNLRQAGRGVVGRSHLGRDALVVAQTASALVLLVGAALLVRSFLALTRVDPGYDTANIFTFQIDPENDGPDDGPSYARFHKAFLERLAAQPGVESVGLTYFLPLDEGAQPVRAASERTEASGEEAPLLRATVTGGDYFQTMGIDLVRGRLFEAIDEVPGITNAIVSSAAAELLWPGEDPIDKRFRIGSDEAAWQTVVGVVEDIFLTDFRQEAADPMIYLPLFGPVTVGSPAYVVKSARASLLAPEIRELVREAAPNSPMFRIFTMEDLATRSMAWLSFTMLMLALTAGMALILGAVGIYGVLSYVVSQRTREIAVRMALGAQAPGLRRMVVFQGGRVAFIGVVLGVLVAVVATRFLATLLFGVRATDLSTFVGMSSVMLAVALLASYVPARRASAVDPMQSLRTE